MPKIKKRSDGRYQISIVTGRKDDGTYDRKVIYGKTEREVKQKALELQNSVANGNYNRQQEQTFAAFADMWFENHSIHLREMTKKQYHSALHLHLNPVFGAKKLKDIRAMDLQKVYTNLSKKGLKKKSYKSVTLVANLIMNEALKNDILQKNPFMFTKIPQNLPSGKRSPLTNTQRILVEKSWKSHRMGIPVLIMLYAGLRKGELIALEWEDIDLDRKTIRINKAAHFDQTGNQVYIDSPKTESSKATIAIPDLLVEALKTAQKSSGLVCPSAKGVVMTHSAFNRAWQHYQGFLSKQASEIELAEQFETFTPHQLRHTYATILFSSGVDIMTAQKQLRHADVETTLKVYTHLTKEKEQISLDALNKALSEKLIIEDNDKPEEPKSITFDGEIYQK